MKALVVVLLVFAVAGPALAQDAIPKLTQFTVKSATDGPVTFRVDTRGSWLQISRAAGIVVRHEGDLRIVDITGPATLDIGGEGELEINLVAAEGSRLELSPLPNEFSDDRAIFIRGATIALRRSAGHRQISVIKSDEVITRPRSN
jgi:hypothetical protein